VGSLIFSNAYKQNLQIKGGGGTLSKPREGIPTPPTPTPKPEGGISALPTPTLTKDRVPPPSGCTDKATVSDGVTTELPFPHAQHKGGTPPTQKFDRGYPTPLSKK